MADFYRAGFGMKKVVEPLLKDAYHSTLVADIVKNGNRIVDGDTTVLLAEAFGFCYGVDRAVQYAYETRNKFPDKTIYITNEIIHNPFVNRKLQEMGVRFLIGRDRGGSEMEEVQAGDIVLLPAFGAPIPAIEELKKKEAVLVDTTCGSVVNVWKNVEKYAREQITSIVHGKIEHEETRATVSRVSTYPGAHCLVLRDEEEAEILAPLAQRREGDVDRVEAEEEVAAEPPVRGLGLQVAVGRRDDPHVDAVHVGVPDRAKLLGVEHLEELRLGGER